MSFPQSTPQVMKGAIVGIDPFNPLASIIVFQYNPDTLTRTLQAQSAGGEGGDRSEALRLKGAPVETIKLDVEIDATDQLERDDALARALGIYPQLSALEMLIYPKSALVIANTVLLAAGDDRGDAAGGAADALHLGAEAGAAGAPDRVQHHRGGLRRAA